MSRDSDRPSRGDDTIAVMVPAARPEPRTAASLVVIQGREIGRDFLLRRRSYVLGRDPDADITIPDDVASRRHAAVEAHVAPGGGGSEHWLVDLQSTNGSFVNGERVQRQGLQDGDRIQIGETILKFTLVDELEARFQQEIRDRIRYDRLTGLLTRESVLLALEVELRRAASSRQPLSVLMMDLDRFKSVNDSYGHLVGSAVLSMVGGVIQESLRVADVAGRYGGEEFVAYLAETPADFGMTAAERIRRALEAKTLEHGDTAVKITISIGVAWYPHHGHDVTSLIDRADRALYTAKESGRNRVVLAP